MNKEKAYQAMVDNKKEKLKKLKCFNWLKEWIKPIEYDTSLLKPSEPRPNIEIIPQGENRCQE